MTTLTLLWLVTATRGHRILTRDRTAEGGFFTGDVNVTLASREQRSRLQQSRWCRYCFFCCVHSIAVTHNAFQWAGQPQKLPIPLGDLDPTYYIVPWAHPIGIPRWRMAWRCLRDAMFNRFDRTPQLVRDRQTDIWPQHICASIASCGKNSSQNTNSENVLTVMSILQRYPYSLGLASHNSIHKRPRMHG